MKMLIQILSMSLFICFSFTGNTQVNPQVKLKNKRYQTSTKKTGKSLKMYKPKQAQKKKKQYVIEFVKGNFVMVDLEKYCSRFANSDCDDMPTYCEKYYSKCDSDDNEINDNASRFAVIEMDERRGGDIPDECQVLIDNCYPDPRLRDFQTFLHSPRDVYSISIKTPKGKTIAYSNTKYGKSVFSKNIRLSKLKIRMPKYKGAAVVRITNLKTKKIGTFKTKLR